MTDQPGAAAPATFVAGEREVPPLREGAFRVLANRGHRETHLYIGFLPTGVPRQPSRRGVHTVPVGTYVVVRYYVTRDKPRAVPVDVRITVPDRRDMTEVAGYSDMIRTKLARVLPDALVAAYVAAATAVYAKVQDGTAVRVVDFTTMSESALSDGYDSICRFLEQAVPGNSSPRPTSAAAPAGPLVPRDPGGPSQA